MNRFYIIISSILLLGLGGVLIGMGLITESVDGAELPMIVPSTHLEDGFHYPATISTTVRDFFLPGTQPGVLEHEIFVPSACTLCHRGYGQATNTPTEQETWTAWQGSMMALAGLDPVFWAALDVANADADNAGEFCLRCHVPRGWFEGRSTPADGSALVPGDFEGVQCEVCHRLVDPVYTVENPVRDVTVLAGITATVPFPASAMMILDPQDHRRGPFQLEDDWEVNPHSGVAGVEEFPLKSPYHQEAAICGTCHDILNPLFSWNEGTGSYEPNQLDMPAPITGSFPIETTYSEWLLSDYNTPQGVYAPQFGGNKDFVSTCQDCHMRDVTGAAGWTFFDGEHLIREDMPLHDLTGVNTWVPQTVLAHPEFGNQLDAEQVAAINSGITRARYMLKHSATVAVTQQGNLLMVRVQNETGHKLPSGYPEGRRMWLQVVGYDAGGNVVYQSGAYDAATGVLTQDGDLKIYEAELGLTPSWAGQVGLPAGVTFHFAMNNTVISDNRIPPRGYNFSAFAGAGAAPASNGAPDPTLYADGQFWDETAYTMPANVAYGSVRLLHQIASKEYIEFLRDNNPFPADPNNRGQILYDLWEQTGRSAPEIMAEVPFGAQLYLPVVVGE